MNTTEKIPITIKSENDIIETLINPMISTKTISGYIEKDFVIIPLEHLKAMINKSFNAVKTIIEPFHYRAFVWDGKENIVNVLYFRKEWCTTTSK